VVVEDGVSITSSILCNGCRVANNATIGKGCVVSFNVIVGANFNLHPFTKLTAYTDEIPDYDDDEKAIAAIYMGEDGVGSMWMLKTEDSNTLVPWYNEEDDDSVEDVISEKKGRG